MSGNRSRLTGSSLRLERSGLVVLVAFNLIALTIIGYRNQPHHRTHRASQWHPRTTHLSASPLLTFPGESWTEERTAAPVTCDYCLLNPEDVKCIYGRDNIKLSRAFDGSGVRVRRMLEKAIRGEPIGIGVSIAIDTPFITLIF